MPAQVTCSQDFPIITLWELSVVMESRDLIRFGPKHNATNPSLQMQFDFDGSAGVRDIHDLKVWADGRTHGHRLQSLGHNIIHLVFKRSRAADSVVGDGFRLKYSAFIFGWIFFIVNKTNHKNLDEYELQQDSITDFGISCP